MVAETMSLAAAHLSSVGATPPPGYSPEHEAFRDSVRRFVEKEIEPFVSEWDETETFPRELYKKAAEIGILGVGFPEEYGGIDGTDIYHTYIVAEELARAGGGGVQASLLSHSIGCPPINVLGTPEQKSKWLPPVLAGEKISALAITEPSGGSDVAQLQTVAHRDGDHYVVNGSKTYITSGIRADLVTVAVRTGDMGLGGISLLVIEAGTPGFDRTPLKKMGWWASDTATLYFDDCRVPVENMLGEENKGFLAVMNNFNMERVGMAAGANALARVCVEEAIDYARERMTFGKRLADHQVIRHKIVDMMQAVNATQAYLENIARRIMAGEQPVADYCMLKIQATQTLELCAREAMQILGGAGFMRGNKVERIYREVRVYAIGGGSEEIMRDLAARQMGI